MIFPRMVDTFADLVPSEDQPDGELVFVRDSFSLWISLDGRWFGVFNSELQGVIDDNQLRLDALEGASTGAPGETSGDIVSVVSNPGVAEVITSLNNPALKIFNYSMNNLYYDVFDGSTLLGSGAVDHDSTSVFHPNVLASLRIEFKLHPNSPFIPGGHIVVESAGG